MLRIWTDRKIEEIIARLLQVGVLLSGLVVLCGGAIYLLRHGHEPADYAVFRGEPNTFKTLSGIVRSAADLRGRGIIQFGLLLLIATPVARVAFSIWGFAAERDRMYVAIAALVLTVLLYSLLASPVG